jgi:ABC-type transporter Mla MlaB component
MGDVSLDPTAAAPVAIRPGEHACCRFGRADDRDRLAGDFVGAGLGRGSKVVYLHDRDDVAELMRTLALADARVERAQRSGQIEVLPAREAYAPDGTFEVERMLARLREEHERALAAGHAGLHLLAEMSWALGGVAGAERVHEYEARVDRMMDDCPTAVFLCEYDHGRFSIGALADAVETHAVDLAPELAALRRAGRLGAARLPGETLRLAGELDFGSAEAVGSMLGAQAGLRLQLDLADVDYIDVAGLRALRGPLRRPLTITSISTPVRRLLTLIAWDTDPDVDLPEAA